MPQGHSVGLKKWIVFRGGRRIDTVLAPDYAEALKKARGLYPRSSSIAVAQELAGTPKGGAR